MEIHLWNVEVTSENLSKAYFSICNYLPYFSIELNIERAKRHPPMTKKVSTAIGFIETKDDHQVWNHSPPLSKYLLLAFGNARTHAYRCPLKIIKSLEPSIALNSYLT